MEYNHIKVRNCCIIAIVVALMICSCAYAPEQNTLLSQIGLDRSDIAYLVICTPEKGTGITCDPDAPYLQCTIDNPEHLDRFFDILNAVELVRHLNGEEFTQVDFGGGNALVYLRFFFYTKENERIALTFRHYHPYKQLVHFGDDSPFEFGAWEYTGRYDDKSIVKSIQSVWKEIEPQWEYAE